MTNEKREAAKAVVRAEVMDEKVFGLLNGIKDEQAAGFRRVDERMSEFAGKLGRIEGAWEGRQCPIHQQEIRDLGTRMDKVEATVAKQGWKLALLISGILGAAGLLWDLGKDTIKDAIKPPAAKASEAPTVGTVQGGDLGAFDVFPSPLDVFPLIVE